MENKLKQIHMASFSVPQRTPSYGWSMEDFCKFYSYVFVNGDKLSFRIEMEDACSICGYVDNLRIHHIIPFSEFGKHSGDNLIILCHKCHKDVHRNNITLKQKGVLDLKWIKQYNQLIDLSKRFSSVSEFKVEVIDKINLIYECLKLDSKRTSHIPFDKFVIKLP
jgi:hypothetical protein